MTTGLVLSIVLGVLGWLAFALLAWWIWTAPNTYRDLPGRAAYRFLQVYSRLLHRVKVEGREHIPMDAGNGWRGAEAPLIVIANHTAGCDPLIVQSALPFEPRWIMAEDMRVSVLEPLWDFSEIITLDRRSNDARGLRTAMAHLKAGGVLGIFPEGHLERPARRLLPFEPGVAMMIRRSKARVLPVIIDGTPQKMAAWDSLLMPSNSSLRFLPVIEPEHWEGKSPTEIAEELRALYQRETGWGLNDVKPKMDHDPVLVVDFIGRYVDHQGQRWEPDADGVFHPTGEPGVLSGDEPEARIATERGALAEGSRA